jgi:hypothetical protein
MLRASHFAESRAWGCRYRLVTSAMNRKTAHEILVVVVVVVVVMVVVVVVVVVGTTKTMVKKVKEK